jgi:hypothetical protein
MEEEYVLIDNGNDDDKAVYISLTPKKIAKIADALKIENDDIRLRQIVFMTECLMGFVWNDFFKSSKVASEDYNACETLSNQDCAQ